MLKWVSDGESWKVSMFRHHELDALRYIEDRTGVSETRIGKPTKKKKKIPDWPPKPEKWWEDDKGN
jgi:hypothetical protein